MTAATASNVRKAAVLLTCLPQENAAALLGKLEPKQVEAVSIEIARLGRISGEEREAVIHSFAEENPNSVVGEDGNLALAKSLMEKALGKDAAATIDNVQQTIQALPFSFLRQVDAENLQAFILDEHPQTIALVLSHLPPAYGAEVIGGLPAEKQLAVVHRIASMGQTNPEVINEVERGLESRMASVMSQSYENAGGVGCVAEILNVTDRATERSILENLAQEDPDLVEEIRGRMFVFRDILKLSDKDVQNVLKNVETSQWALALKGETEEIRQKVLGNLSQRGAQMLGEEMEYLGPVRSSEVEGMQQQIVEVIRRLEEGGMITIGGAEEEDSLIQ